jgi:hypothetical protein
MATRDSIIQDKKDYDAATHRNKDKPYLMAWSTIDLKAVVKLEKIMMMVQCLTQKEALLICM